MSEEVVIHLIDLAVTVIVVLAGFYGINAKQAKTNLKIDLLEGVARDSVDQTNKGNRILRAVHDQIKTSGMSGERPGPQPVTIVQPEGHPVPVEEVEHDKR